MSALQGTSWVGSKLVKGLASIDETLENANILSTLSGGEEGSTMVDATNGKELASDYSDVRQLSSFHPCMLLISLTGSAELLELSSGMCLHGMTVHRG